MRLAERLWSKVAMRGEADCWEWQAGKSAAGYGRISVGGAKGSNQYAHRVAWALTYGDPGESDVCHHCDNPGCCNPKHLFLGTAKDNMADKMRKGRARVAKLTRADVDRIRVLAASRSQLEIGRLYGVSYSTIGSILRGRTWRMSDAA